MRPLRALFAAFGLMTAPLPLAAQQSATLIADQVQVAPGEVLIASGHVEMLHDGIRVKATSVRYDGQTGDLQIIGPLTIVSEDGTILTAQAADLSSDFKNGVLRSARLVLDERLQMAAAEIHRVDGRYTQLYKTVASTCEVCASNPVPLWRIRATRIIHDEEERQLYFENARFELGGVPIIWLPRLRLPDPTLERAAGFLSPEIRSTDALGFGIKLPYFIPIGDHKDLTLTPYVSTDNSRTLEARYRQAFASGDIEINAAASSDDIRPGDLRTYLFAEGYFNIQRDYTLTFDIETVSDTGYLLDYDYSDKDRLDSEIAITRTKRDEHAYAGVVAYRSLRSSESNETAPTVVADLVWDKRFRPRLLGGNGGIRLAAHSHYRRSNFAYDGTDDDSIVDGRDITRYEAQAFWRRDWIMAGGLVLDLEGRIDLDYSRIDQDADYDTPVSRATPQAAVTLSYPLSKTTRRANHVITPIAQLVWAEDTGTDLPNDESTLIELDEGNLFSFSRYASNDQIERGLRANLGVQWTRFGNDGSETGLTLGRIIRSEDLGQFAGYPGLEGESSDWLAALRYEAPGNFSLINRALFDDSFELSMNELRLDWEAERLDIGASYIWMEASPLENLDTDVSELTLDSAWQFKDNWTASLDMRYDFVADRAASAELGLAYANECIEIDVSVSRRFTSSTSVEPTTDFGLSVSLVGFGGGADGNSRKRSHCAQAGG
ncbi:LPS-assembly protein LptD [Alphaproteobacteria bacterium KMM 3653]|uniref:LPS-assembly protein LptD n=1 Tax=Harenicola maris TaxID=2841044 RepID=A0AAP2CMX0_9RHOB|nr:LPS-assembly protein LptD [Harenicola maris]